MSWCLASNADLDLTAALSTHVFADPTGRLADAVLSLGDAYQLVTPQFPNLATIVTNLYYPQLTVGRGLTAGLTTEELDLVDRRLDEARRAAELSNPDRPDGARLVAETVFSIDLVELLVRDARWRLLGDGTLGSVAAPVRRDLASDLAALIARYRTLWLDRNRPGGLVDSVAWLENLRSAYETGRPDPTWGGLSTAAP